MYLLDKLKQIKNSYQELDSRFKQKLTQIDGLEYSKVLKNRSYRIEKFIKHIDSEIEYYENLLK